MALELARQEGLYYYDRGDYHDEHDHEGVYTGGDYHDDQSSSTVGDHDGLRTHEQQLGATFLASKFAANTRRGANIAPKGGPGLDPDASSLKMPKKLFKPEDPDFSDL